jgi:hypothetical protein
MIRGREVSARPARSVLPLEGSPVYEAVELGLLRQIGLAAPEGRCDGAGRWWPASVERAGCCEAIRTPSRSYPWTIYRHCWTLAHVASRYGLQVPELRRLMSVARTLLLSPRLASMSVPVREQLATKADQDLLRLLVSDRSSKVRLVVARRSHDDVVLGCLAADPDALVCQVARANRYLPEQLRAPISVSPAARLVADILGRVA